MLLQEVEQLKSDLSESMKNDQVLFEVRYTLEQTQTQNTELKTKLEQAEQKIIEKQSEVDAQSLQNKRSREKLAWNIQSKAQEVRALKSELKNMKKSLMQELRAHQDDSKQKMEFILDSTQRFGRQFRDKDLEHQNLTQRFEAVIQQLEQATQAKDKAQMEIIDLTTQREKL